MTLRKFPLRVIVLAIMLPIWVVAGCGEVKAEAGNAYRKYVESLMARPPEGVVFREDLETYLDQLASSYRRSKRRPALAADPALREAARAQAIDMMLAGRSSHRSRTGHDFKARFAAFLSADNTAWVSGENAASDRRKGAVDKARAKRLFQLWIDSTGHRKNLLRDRYVHVSTGAVQRGDEIWSVQIFWSEPIRTDLVIQ